MSSESDQPTAARLATALEDQLYIVATKRDRITVAISNDLSGEYVRTHVERITEGHDVDFEVEHAGAHDDNNDRWRIRLDE